jgi:hypothetical protein
MLILKQQRSTAFQAESLIYFIAGQRPAYLQSKTPQKL